MNWLIGSGQALIGVALVVGWYLTLRLLRGRMGSMTNMKFSVVPALFLLWVVFGFIMIVNGVGRI